MAGLRILTLNRTETTFETGSKGERRLPNFFPWSDILLPPIPCNDFPRVVASDSILTPWIRPIMHPARCTATASSDFTSPFGFVQSSSSVLVPLQTRLVLNCGSNHYAAISYNLSFKRLYQFFMLVLIMELDVAARSLGLWTIKPGASA